MLQVTIDAFSGRDNPSGVISNPEEANALLKEFSRNRGVITDVNTSYSGLGFRGVILELLSDDGSQTFDLPPVFKVGGGSSQNEDKGLEIAERLIRAISTYSPSDSGLEGYLMQL